MTRISHSAKEMFLQCGEKYRLHYQERLRSPLIPSPLFLGSAFDEAIGAILLRKKNPEKLTEKEKEILKLDPYVILDNELTTREHNGESVYMPNHHLVKYFSQDYTPELLEEEDFLLINSTAERQGFEPLTVELVEEFIQSCKNEIKTKKALERDSQVLYNTIHWCCIRRKLRFLLGKYEEDVIPLLHEVHEVQKKVELSDDEHSLIGYIDFKASFVDEPDVVYTLDNKLASKAYPSDALMDAVQLATYCEHEQSNKAGFVVTEKKLRIREPRHRIQILKGELPEELFEKTFDEFGEVVYNIQQGNFEKSGMDGSKQECFSFGQRCPYYNTCRGEPEKDFLIKLEDK